MTQKNGLQPICPRTRLRCFGGAVRNGGTSHTFRAEETAELLPKNLARKARIQIDGRHLLFGEYLLRRTKHLLSSELAEKQANEVRNLTPTEVR